MQSDKVLSAVKKTVFSKKNLNLDRICQGMVLSFNRRAKEGQFENAREEI